jgi:hypothetical protein
MLIFNNFINAFAEVDSATERWWIDLVGTVGGEELVGEMGDELMMR